MNISIQKMQQYIVSAQQWQHKHSIALEKRRIHGLEIAQQAAAMLKTEFRASRIVLFGSLLSPTFHENSDIDLAVWNLPEKSYFKAVSKLLGLSEFEIDLVEVQSARPEILAAILQGQEL
ncbi:nucleotidyltransferase domain-containing protein [Spirulina subsalsa FACHB-351]|uniref:Nucleotidyltransferase domain-containing protein n=1 Tax=Spirulina subsalsa FACHB-351 TaxID=234711 RepID=A0ABT3L220_9CYAN|nr:nucleotidyltransferase domain-containing protein [Spirulina subsalsa]MCW6035549.1 nucleotidyltransferase domain-containing protein [Spirulina subsalsa FACHB-351]